MHENIYIKKIYFKKFIFNSNISKQFKNNFKQKQSNFKKKHAIYIPKQYPILAKINLKIQKKRTLKKIGFFYKQMWVPLLAYARKIEPWQSHMI